MKFKSHMNRERWNIVKNISIRNVLIKHLLHANYLLKVPLGTTKKEEIREKYIAFLIST